MSTEPLRSHSPQAPTDLVGEYEIASESHVQRAVTAARSAQREWWSQRAAGRAAGLSAAANRLRAQREEATALVVREVGKPVGEASGEVTRSISILDYYAQSCYAALGEQYPPSLDGLLYSERRPHGVAGLITPWNFPLAIPLWKAAPALAAGNAVVLKPSPDAPACAALLERIFAASLPPGTFAVANGYAEAGQALVANADVVSFTGSRQVGRAIAAQAGERMVPAQCEMGGQNAAIILPDADPGRTAPMVAAAAMGYAGQKCTATRRVIVVDGDHDDDAVEAVAEAVAALTPSPPEDSASVVGPVINQAARQKVSAAIALARSVGGEVLAEASAGDSEGWFVSPTFIGGLPADHELAREETFGPLASLWRAADVKTAVELANSVPYGLVTSVHGRDLEQVLAAVEGIDTGLVKVNAPTTGVDFYAPFGGQKESSYGPREQGPGALDFYSTTRTVTIAPA